MRAFLLQAILGHPLALVKLGMFLRDVNAVRHHREEKPTVIIGPADSHGNCLVVAVTKEPMSGQPGKVSVKNLMYGNAWAHQNAPAHSTAVIWRAGCMMHAQSCCATLHA